MFCPQCKAEYRRGFHRCADCDVELVERLPAESDYSVSEIQADDMKRVWSCDERESCVYVCAGLRAAGIPFKVSQRKHQIFWRLEEHYEVFVPTKYYDKARAIAELGVVDFSDSSEDRKIMGLPDAGPGLPEHEADNPSSRIRTEEATVEVWSEKPEERAWFEPVKGLAWMIELSLHENGISTHIDLSENGLRKIFVRPEDEFQAREIIREIETGAPPT